MRHFANEDSHRIIKGNCDEKIIYGEHMKMNVH